MKNVLSIQSHVVYGHAGNAAAVFPMQRLGMEVWPLNTVQFSNHTQYTQGWKGVVLPGEHMTEITVGLENIDVLKNCNAVISGYIGAAEQGNRILDIVSRVKKANPNAIYFCDPVMGHPAKGCKVAPGVAEFHRDHSIAVADMMSPNVLELGKLMGEETDTFDQCLSAARALQKRGPKVVLVKHLSYAARNKGCFEMLLVTDGQAWHIHRPLVEFDRHPVGVGDLTSGAMLACLLNGMSPLNAFEFVTASVYEVILATKEANAFELQLIAAQDRLAKPAHIFKAELL